ncbi:MAG: hypothetical protein KDC87_06010, partial [Planctomycetes bacterium]|nr:hypothetical protein [Planctomycetota bacterium]
MSGAVRLGEPFFLRHTLVMLLLVAAGFLGNALAAGVPPPSALVVVHAALSSAWYLLSCLQPWLVRRGAQRAHVRFGWASVVIALGVLVSGVWVAAEHFRDQPVRDARAAMLLFFNLLNILQF